MGRPASALGCEWPPSWALAQRPSFSQNGTEENQERRWGRLKGSPPASGSAGPRGSWGRVGTVSRGAGRRGWRSRRTPAFCEGSALSAPWPARPGDCRGQRSGHFRCRIPSSDWVPGLGVDLGDGDPPPCGLLSGSCPLHTTVPTSPFQPLPAVGVGGDPAHLLSRGRKRRSKMPCAWASAGGLAPSLQPGLGLPARLQKNPVPARGPGAWE